MSERTTPTPWRVEADIRVEKAFYSQDDREVLAGWDIVDANGSEVVGCEGILSDGKDRADRICRAVNAHAEMVEALNEARLQIEYLHEKFAETGSGNTALAKIRSALAKATAGETTDV